MDKKIQEILNDLYNIDPSFKSREQELINIINKLLAAKPDVKFDERFAQELKLKLQKEAAILFEQSKPISLLSNFMNLPKIAYALGGALITLMIAIPVLNYINQPNLSNSDVLLSQQKVVVKKLAKNAFGSFAQNTTGVMPNIDGRGSAEMLGAPAVVDSNIEKQNSAVSANEEAEAPAGEMAQSTPGFGGGAVSGKMIMPDYMVTNYEFSYEGEELNLSDSELAVLKREKSKTLSKKFAQALEQLNFDFVNLQKFQNKEVANLQISEDREFGYSMYVNLFDNSLSINTNWEKWPQVERSCFSEDCLKATQLKIEDVPDDSVIIDLADKFLKNYNINLDNYGEPQVVDNWKQHSLLRDEKTYMYIPDIIGVVYPLQIDGRDVYTESGELSGLYVDVNIRYKKAAGVRNIIFSNFLSSDYSAETNSTTIIEFAKNGGLAKNYQYPEAKKIIALKLGTPIKALVQYWHYEPGQGKGGEELLVPALVFPILNKDEAPGYYRENIVVPLIKEIIESRQDNSDLIPMPLLEVPEKRAVKEGIISNRTEDE